MEKRVRPIVLFVNDRSFSYSGRMATADTTDGRLIRGEKTRAEILARAVDLASIDGLEGLTIGRLAQDLGLSKSGLIRHFGSKEELQLATIAAASELFAEAVLSSAFDLEPGLERLQAVVASWLEYLVGDTFAGGCFFYATAPEVDRRPGRARDALVNSVRAGIALMRQDVAAAQAAGDLDPDVDPDQIVFEIHAAIQEANLWYLLLDDVDAVARSRAAVDATMALRRSPNHTT